MQNYNSKNHKAYGENGDKGTTAFKNVDKKRGIY